MTTPEIRRRPGGRSARVRRAALEATLAELAEVGYADMTVEGVAGRAGVNKTTLYRRFGSREGLLLEAMLELGRRQVPIPDTGSLRGDLLAYGRSIVACRERPGVEGAIRAAAAAPSHDSPLADASREFWAARLALTDEMIDRAVERGELSRPAHGRALVESLLGAIYFRILLSRERMDEAFVEGVVDALLGDGPAGRSAD
jgi:AcrR family transcriptional regulator